MDAESENSNLPHPQVNHTLLWFRAMFWIAPPGYAIASLMGLMWFQDFLFVIPFSPWLWLISYIAFVIATGFYSARLSPRRWLRTNGVSRFVWMFCAVHLVLVPLVLIVICVVMGLAALLDGKGLGIKC